ncbi:MAG: CatB-related O-acetyltransferase [Caulobacterales bacterium]
MSGPDPNNPYPVAGHTRVGMLRALVTRPNIEVGDFSYYDDPAGPERFQDACVLHHYDFLGDKLIIGKFCAIASDVRFIMNGANHLMRGFSTYPFNIMGGGWEEGLAFEDVLAEGRGDTIVGNDVWIGMEAMILPGVTISDGAIIGARAVVSTDVAPYSIVAGNPARRVRDRFESRIVSELLTLAWWDWPIDKITRNVNAIRGADLAALQSAV